MSKWYERTEGYRWQSARTQREDYFTRLGGGGGGAFYNFGVGGVENRG